MCGRFASHLPPDAIRALFATSGPVPNLAPTRPLERGADERRHGDPPAPRDGRAPAGSAALRPDAVLDEDAQTSSPDQRPIGDGATNGMFKGALASRRCLVPADAFYEWRAMPYGKQPYAIAWRDGSPLAFAGVWEWWKAADGELVRTFAILTTAANATMSVLHERMPVALEPDTWSLWLGDTVAAVDLMRPAADDVLHLWPVSRAVNSVRNNGADLSDPIDDPHAPPPSDAPAGENPA